MVESFFLIFVDFDTFLTKKNSLCVFDINANIKNLDFQTFGSRRFSGFAQSVFERLDFKEFSNKNN